MKKLAMVCLAAVLLCGCDRKVACTYVHDYEDITVTDTYTIIGNETVKTVEYEMKYDLTNASEYSQNLVETTMPEAFSENEPTEDYMTQTITVKNHIIRFVMKIDFVKAEKEDPDANAPMLMDDFISQQEDLGFTCK